MNHLSCLKLYFLLCILIGISSQLKSSDAFDDLNDSDSFPPPPPPVFFEPSDSPTPSDSLPVVTDAEEVPTTPVRSSTARVSFREPISCSYSVEVEEWEEEEGAEMEGREGEDEEQEEEDGEEAEGSLGHRLRFCTEVPSQMDLLGKIIMFNLILGFSAFVLIFSTLFMESVTNVFKKS